MTEELVPTADLRELIAGNALPEVEDPATVQQRIVDQVLSAETEDEVFALGGSTAARDLVNVPLVLKDVRVLASQIEGAGPVYVLLQTYDENGQQLLVNTGAPRVMAQAWRAKQLGLLPKRVQVVEVAKAKPGQSAPLGLAAL